MVQSSNTKPSSDSFSPFSTSCLTFFPSLPFLHTQRRNGSPPNIWICCLKLTMKLSEELFVNLNCWIAYKWLSLSFVPSASLCTYTEKSNLNLIMDLYMCMCFMKERECTYWCTHVFLLKIWQYMWKFSGFTFWGMEKDFKSYCRSPRDLAAI